MMKLKDAEQLYCPFSCASKQLIHCRGALCMLWISEGTLLEWSNDEEKMVDCLVGHCGLRTLCEGDC